MRKSLILMLIATLLVGAFLVSCNSDISSESSNGDKLVKVTIAGNTKGISAVSTSDDADNYYWYYSATKDDTGVYRTGQTDWKAVKANGETGLSGADLGYFSSGAWKFSFYGYTTAQNTKPTDPITSSVYYQENKAVTVVKTADTPTYVSVTLKEGSLGEIATLVIETMNWKYTPENPTDYTATLANLGDNKTATIHFAYQSGTDAYTDITTATGEVKLYTSDNVITTTASEAAYAKADFSFTGNYTIPASIDGKENTIKFWVTIGNETVGDEDTINVVAYSGGVVTLSKDSTGVAVADNEAFNKVIINENTIGFTAKRSVAVSENKSAAKTIVTKAAPSTESNALTSITFPKGALVASAVDNTTYDVEMDVVVYQTEAAASEPKFVITSAGNPSTFAGLDLSVDLIKTVGNVAEEPQKLTTFNNEAVTVTTYIAKNLTGVQVVYTGNGSDNSQPSDVSYDPVTGALTFTTTHFSAFAVGANEKVYDKTTNTGYTVAAFNNLSASDISDHEFILLDASVANSIDDSRDVFNAGYKWTVAHKANDLPNTTDFAGGYGTKIEPYLVYDKRTMQNISTFYNNEYCYFKVDIEKTTAGKIDCSQWTPVEMYGCFDGSGVKFINLDECLFLKVKAKNNTSVVVKDFNCTFDVLTDNTGAVIDCVYHADTVCNIYLSKINVHGRFLSTYAASAYIGWGNGGNGNYVYNFTDCVADITLGATNNTVSGFVYHPYAQSDEYHIYNSAFIGSALVAGTWGPYEFNAQGGGTTTATYTQEFLNSYSLSSVFSNAPSVANNSYTYTRYTSTLTGTKGSITTNNINGTLPNVGEAFETTKVGGAEKAIVSYNIGPNADNAPNLYSIFLSEEIDLTSVETGASFSTSLVKYYKIAINGVEVVSSENHDSLPNGVNQDLNIINLKRSDYNGTVHTADVKIVQFDPDTNVLTIWTVAIPCANQQ